MDGIVGPATLRALNGVAAPAATAGAAPAAGAAAASGTPLVWYEEALRLVGTKEKAALDRIRR